LSYTRNALESKGKISCNPCRSVTLFDGIPSSRF